MSIYLPPIAIFMEFELKSPNEDLETRGEETLI